MLGKKVSKQVVSAYNLATSLAMLAKQTIIQMISRMMTALYIF